MLQKQLLGIFLVGLKKDIQIIVRAQKPDSLEDAIEFAKIEEEQFANKRDFEKCDICSKSNHKTSDCRVNTYKKCSFCNNFGHTYTECRKRRMPPQNFNRGRYNNYQSNFRQHSFNNNASFSNSRPRPHFSNGNSNNNHFYQNRDQNSYSYSRQSNSIPNRPNSGASTPYFLRNRKHLSFKLARAPNGNFVWEPPSTATIQPTTESTINEMNSKKIYVINFFGLTTFVDLNSAQLTSESKFLVDTGSEVSLINESSLKRYVQRFTDNQILLKGIDNVQTNIYTKGYCYLEINIGNRSFEHVFYVVPDSFPVSFNGIIGCDLLKSTDAVINLHKNTLTIENFEFKLHSIFKSLSDKTQNEGNKLENEHCLEINKENSKRDNEFNNDNGQKPKLY